MPLGFISFLSSLVPWKREPVAPFPGQPFPPRPKPRPVEVEPSFEFNEPPGLEADVFGSDPIDRFVHYGEWFDSFDSSNVTRIRYNPELSELIIEYKNGNQYAYQDVSIREAESFARAASKGKWVWNQLRVRGKGNFWAYRKPYQLIGVSGAMPQWMRSAKTRKIHGLIGPEGLRRRKILGIDIPGILAPKWLTGRAPK